MSARTIGFCAGKCLALGAALALGMVTLTVPASAADFVLKFGTATMNETQHQFIKFYKEEVEKASGGRIEVQIYPASQLGPIPAEIQGVQLGTVQGYIGPVDFFVGVDPRFGVFSAPMLFKSNENAIATVQDPAIQKTMFDMLAPKRMVGIATMDIGASDYGAKKPIMRLADFAGQETAHQRHRARAQEDGGARRHRDRHAAVRRGAGARSRHDRRHDFRAFGVRSFKMNDLLKVITVTNDTYIISLAVISKPWFDTLPPDLQKIVIDAGKDTQAKAQQ